MGVTYSHNMLKQHYILMNSNDNHNKNKKYSNFNIHIQVRSNQCFKHQQRIWIYYHQYRFCNLSKSEEKMFSQVLLFSEWFMLDRMLQELVYQLEAFLHYYIFIRFLVLIDNRSPLPKCKGLVIKHVLRVGWRENRNLLKEFGGPFLFAKNS